MKELADLLAGSLSSGSVLALPLALMGGLVTGLNPCCLALYPAAAATCCAVRGDRMRTALGASLAFIAGVALATASLGVAAALAGRTMTDLGGWPRYAVALVPVVMGLHLLGWVRLRLPSFAPSKRAGGIQSVFATGLLLSLVLAPCGTPVLASVLSYAAYEGSIAYGALLLFLFGLGAGLPLLLACTVAGGIAARMDRAGWRAWLDRATGVVLLAVGFYLLLKAP